MNEYLNIAFVVLSIIVLPSLGYMFKLNTRIVKLEDEISSFKNTNKILFIKIDKISDILTELQKEVHHLVKIEDNKKYVHESSLIII